VYVEIEVKGGVLFCKDVKNAIHNLAGAKSIHLLCGHTNQLCVTNVVRNIE